MIIKPNTVDVLDTTCPSCKSNDTRSFSMIFQSGTSVGIVSGIGVDGDGGIGLVGGRGASRTLLAQKVAPPSSPDMPAALGFVLVVFGAIATGIGADYIAVLFNFTLLAPLIGFCLAIVFGVLGFKAIYDGYKKHAADYKKQADYWVNSWMCLRCGHSWMPTLKRTAEV